MAARRRPGNQALGAELVTGGSPWEGGWGAESDVVDPRREVVADAPLDRLGCGVNPTQSLVCRELNPERHLTLDSGGFKALSCLLSGLCDFVRCLVVRDRDLSFIYDLLQVDS